MKVLFLHCNSIRFTPIKRALKDAEDADKKEIEVKDCLVCLTAVERPDEANPKEIVKRLIENVKDVASQVKVKKIVLYPYAHLSSQLASPSVATKVLKDAKKVLSKDFKVTSAPFGWYKAFSVDVKGHPLSELSREITLEGKGGKAVARPLVADARPQATELSAHARQMKLARMGKQATLEKGKLSENDHRILGPKLGLFTFQEVAPGMVFYLPNGTIIRNLLVEFLREEQTNRGYQEISTPLLLHNNVWEISGHMKHFSDAMFFTNIENSSYALKPMNCPGAIIAYRTSMRSYKDLPLRWAEFGTVSRNELSGVLAGLFRLRIFTQDDAHIFITPSQIEEEVGKVIDLVDHFYKTFGFPYHVELSTRPGKFMGSKSIWDNAEKILEKALKKRKVKHKINKGEGSFYGPKIDFHIKDSLGRTWQLATIQLDFQMPESFDLHYIDKKGSQQRPIIIHRVIYGSIERFIGILVEHYKGKFPVWLSPIQARVLSFTNRNTKYAKEIEQQLTKEGLRVDSDYESETVDYKVREAQIQKIPYVLVIGDKEEKAKSIAVRGRDGKVKFGVKLEKFVEQIKKEIENKS